MPRASEARRLRRAAVIAPMVPASVIAAVSYLIVVERPGAVRGPSTHRMSDGQIRAALIGVELDRAVTVSRQLESNLAQEKKLMDAAVKNPLRAFYVLTAYIVLTLLWRFLVPANEEGASNTLVYMKIFFELGTIPILISLSTHLRARLDDDSRRLLTIVFWIALAAGFGILWIRFSTTHGWYTGHRVYEIGGYRYDRND